MPKISNDPTEEGSVISDAVQQLLTMTPVFICGVNRKANIGNFENIDVYSAIALPMPEAANIGQLTDVELTAIVAHTAEIGFQIVSAETFQRYDTIKKLIAEES